MDAETDPESDDYRQVRRVVDRAVADLRRLGAELVDPVEVPGLDEAQATYVRNSFETEEATDAYLAELPEAPMRSLREILLAGRVNPWRARGLMNVVGRSTSEHEYLPVLQARERLRRAVLAVMADNDLDALVYATFDHQTTVIAPDVLTNPNPEDGYARGNNRYLSPVIGFPALTVPAGLTDDGLPVGLELLGGPFAEATLLRLGYAYEQGTHRREPPATTPALDGEAAAPRVCAVERADSWVAVGRAPPRSLGRRWAGKMRLRRWNGAELPEGSVGCPVEPRATMAGSGPRPSRERAGRRGRYPLARMRPGAAGCSPSRGLWSGVMAPRRRSACAGESRVAIVRT